MGLLDSTPTRKPKFEVYPSGTGYRWRLKAANGEPIAGGEEYTTKAAAINALDALKRATENAEVVELEKQCINIRKTPASGQPRA